MRYKNSEITKKANVYEGGKVTSRRVVTSEGEVVTLGIMQLGYYHFATDASEVMELLQGVCRVKLQDSDEWIEYKAGQNFNITANSSFDIEVIELLDYICHYD